MAKDSNFGKAMYDMFGVGKAPSKAPSTEVEKEISVDKVDAIEGIESIDSIEFKPDPVAGEKVEKKVEKIPEVIIPEIKPVRAGKSIIAAGTFFEGIIKTEGDIEIAGDFKGNVVSEGKVTIMSNYNGNIEAGELALIGCSVEGDIFVKENVDIDAASDIKGNIKASNLNCAGSITGDLDIRDNLTLSEKSQINGNIIMGSMSVARGARVTGKIEMQA